MTFTASLLTLLMLLAVASAFSPAPFRRNVVSSVQSKSTRHQLWSSMKDDDDFADFPPDEGGGADDEDASNVDWDAEWKKVVTNQDQPKARPGSDFYKSDMEIAAIKAANKAQKRIRKIPKPDVPDMRWSSLQGDWKFWVGILVIISIGTSLIANSGVSQQMDDSFYV